MICSFVDVTTLDVFKGHDIAEGKKQDWQQYERTMYETNETLNTNTKNPASG